MPPTTQELVRILARADMAHNLALYCAQYDPTIINKTKSTVGDVQALMLHIRAVISELPQVEAAQIVIRAANAAKSDALHAVRRLKLDPDVLMVEPTEYRPSFDRPMAQNGPSIGRILP